MEMLFLFLMAPLIVVPVVLLSGYAGCGFSIQVGLPTAPSNVVVTAVSVTSVSLSWVQGDAEGGIVFEILRFRDDSTIPEAVPTTSATTITDTGLQPLQRYRYAVQATRGLEKSDPSAEVEAVTPGHLALNPGLMTDQPDLEGFCIVQRIEPDAARPSGTRMRITVRGSTAGDLRLDAVFISQVGNTGNVYDSAVTDITFVAAGVQVPPNTAVTLPIVQYEFDPLRPFLVCFDINAAPGNGNVRYRNPVSVTQAAMYYRRATAEAGTPDRLPSALNPGAAPYNPSSSIYLIETIEVA